MAHYTGEFTRTEGRKCRGCKQTEARCALLGSCCGPATCTHWREWSADGEPLGYDATLDEVTRRRREKERSRSRERYAAKKSAS